MGVLTFPVQAVPVLVTATGYVSWRFELDCYNRTAEF